MPENIVEKSQSVCCANADLIRDRPYLISSESSWWSMKRNAALYARDGSSRLIVDTCGSLTLATQFPTEGDDAALGLTTLTWLVGAVDGALVAYNQQKTIYVKMYTNCQTHVVQDVCGK